jgi:type III secretion protein Q
MPFPFTLPALSRGYAALTPAAASAGRAFAEAASRAVSAQLGVPLEVEARALPAAPFSSRGALRLVFALEALPATAVLELDASLGCAALSHVAGGDAAPIHGLTALPVERTLVELLALVALDAGASTPVDVLTPRLLVGHEDDAIASALAVGLDFVLGARRFRGRLLVPAEAVRALAGRPELLPALEALRIEASLRGGEASLTLDELSALRPGDAVLADVPSPALVLPGGLALRGRLEGALFHVEEIHMTETQAAYPITVAIEIGRATLTFADLAALAPGVALPLDLRRDGTVVLRAGERALARGQLVDIDGALGIRILQIGDLL